jgi:hypothetical protein
VNVDRLIDEAKAKTGLPEGGSETFRPGFEQFVSAYNRSRTLTPAGRTVNEGYVVESLAARFVIEDWIVHHQGVVENDVVRPLFILGLPRAGTSLLLNLLCQDRTRRVYWHWEGHREVPPVQATRLLDDPRIAQRVREIDAAIANQEVNPQHHLEMGDEPTECFWPLARDFKCYLWLTRTQVPDYFHWLLHEADMEAAYRHHKRTLQVMQSLAPGRWTLKFPTHGIAIHALLAVYPDARIILTHRDPADPVASACSSVRYVLERTNTDVDLKYLGHETAELIYESVMRPTAARETHAAVPFYDLHYRRFIANPIDEVRRLYEFLGEPLTPPCEAAMRAELVRQEGRRTRVGAHRYRLEEYGWSHAALYTTFREYLERYEICRETK